MPYSQEKNKYVQMETFIYILCVTIYMIKFSFRISEEEDEMINKLREKGFNISQLLRNKITKEYKKQV